MEWGFVAQYSPTVQGDEATEGDVVSCLEYDHSGTYLAVGDRGGRVTVLAHPTGKSAGIPEAEHVARFQSHEVDFDYLKSVEIEEKINKIRWLPRRSDAYLFLTTNDKTVKLWKVGPTTETAFRAAAARVRAPQQGDGEKDKKKKGRSPAATPSSPNLDPFSGDIPAQQLIASCRRVYGGVHQYHINALSLSTDGEAFISCDDLRLELWHLEHGESLNVVDIKPPAMEDLSEVLTAAHFHPQHCSQFLFSTSKGQVRVGDLRDGSQMRQGRCVCVMTAEVPEGANAFFKEILTSISDACWCGDGHHILSRDYLTLKVWDLRNPRKALNTLPVHDTIKPYLCELYDNDSIFDKFECASGRGGMYAVTGSYKNNFRVYDMRTFLGLGPTPKKGQPQPGDPSTVRYRMLEAAPHSPPRLSPRGDKDGKRGDSRWKGWRDRLAGRKRDNSPTKEPPPQDPEEPEKYDADDWSARVLHVAVHPQRTEIAVAVLNNLYIFNAEGS
eukprot:TRINITY_DN56157_c0_g1_i1.p1 TRINITY_DN56157_c0_g1~~TRINITY_DN56157_c0_g1_i1.p1  ORF type:complete len:499 (+),score=131.40 TRINITY_DN56157_c0_g1_i1:98-1594(+)